MKIVAKYDLTLLLVAAIWGATFVAIKNALVDISPFMFIAIRFTIAFLFLVLVGFKRLRKLNLSYLKAGFLIGTALFGGYALQTVGIIYTTASNAGFISGLAVIFVPFLNFILFRNKPSIYAFIGAMVATIGLAFMSLNSDFQINKGDFLVLLCALSFALQIVLVGKYSPKFDSILLTSLQIGAVALFSWGVAFGSPTEQFPQLWTKEIFIALAICAIPATSLAILIQNKVQQFISPTKAAIIISTEPVFAAIFAYFWGGEVFTLKVIFGGVLMLIGMMMSETKGKAVD